MTVWCMPPARAELRATRWVYLDKVRRQRHAAGSVRVVVATLADLAARQLTQPALMRVGSGRSRASGVGEHAVRRQTRAAQTHRLHVAREGSAHRAQLLDVACSPRRFEAATPHILRVSTGKRW